MSNYKRIEAQAQELRRRELTRVTEAAWSAVTNFLRTRHEMMLRRRPGYIKLRPVNAQPA